MTEQTPREMIEAALTEMTDENTLTLEYLQAFHPTNIRTLLAAHDTELAERDREIAGLREALQELVRLADQTEQGRVPDWTTAWDDARTALANSTKAGS